jgi:hypothetical protein
MKQVAVFSDYEYRKSGKVVRNNKAGDEYRDQKSLI